MYMETSLFVLVGGGRLSGYKARHSARIRVTNAFVFARAMPAENFIPSQFYAHSRYTTDTTTLRCVEGYVSPLGRSREEELSGHNARHNGEE